MTEPTAPSPRVHESCATCRHHRKEMWPADASVTFDEIVTLDDADVPYYFCRAEIPEKDVGLIPICCELFERPAPSGRLAELDARIAALEKRTPGADE